MVQSFGMPLVNCPNFAIYNSVGSTTDLYTFSFVSDSTTVLNTSTWPAKCCTSFCNSITDLIINVHNSRQCASKVGELVYHLQSLTFHFDGRLLVRLSRCWLIYYLSLFDADGEVIAVT